MTDPEIQSTTGPGFVFSLSGAGEALTLHLRGTAEIPSLVAVSALLTRAHAEAVRRRAPRVDVDMRELEFMNSSCFKAFVSWVCDAQELEESDRYTIRFLSSASHHWQQRSLHALRSLADEVVTVE